MELGVRRLKLASTCAPEVKAGAVLEPDDWPEVDAAPVAAASEEVGAGVELGVDLGEAAS